MPKAIVDAAKGLYQTAGAGLFINSGAPLVLPFENVSIDATDTASADASKIVHLVTLTNGGGATLSLSTSNVETGALKVIIVIDDNSTGNTLTVSDGTVSVSSLGARDLVVAIFDGTNWQLGAGAV